MAPQTSTDLTAYCLQLCQQARAASKQLAQLTGQQKQNWLHQAATLLQQRSAELQAANEADLQAAPGYGLTPAAIDRLRLTPAVLQSMVEGLHQVAQLPDPVGEVMESNIRPNVL